MDKPILLVTGATGFIGSHFTNSALARGCRVLAVRRSTVSRFRVEVASGVEFIDKALVELGEADLGGVDVLVHLAAEGATARRATWEECCRVNVTESLALINRAVDAGIPRIVVSGSYAEYGRAGLRFDPIPVDAPLEPTDPYATSKAMAAVAICGLCRSRRFQLSYQRLFSVFGPGQFEENFWPALRRAAQAGEDFKMTEGHQIRDFIPVEEVARQLVQECLRTDLVPGEPRVRNLASGTPQSLREFASFWWAKFGALGEIKFGAVPIRPNEVARFVPEVQE